MAIIKVTSKVIRGRAGDRLTEEVRNYKMLETHTIHQHLKVMDSMFSGFRTRGYILDNGFKFNCLKQSLPEPWKGILERIRGKNIYKRYNYVRRCFEEVCNDLRDANSGVKRKTILSSLPNLRAGIGKRGGLSRIDRCLINIVNDRVVDQIIEDAT